MTDSQDNMQMYVNAVDSGVAFLCSLINEIPSTAIPIDNSTYQSLMAADSKGASLAVQNGKPVALDWQGNVIDLSQVSSTSSYSQPPSLKQLAQYAFQSARVQFQDLQMLGKNFGPATQKYMQQLNAIIDGSDTTSKTLPTAPSDLTT